MRYVKGVWVDEILPSGPTYTISGTGSGQTIDLDQTPTVVGTDLEAAKMNNIEEQLEKITDEVGWNQVLDTWTYASATTITVTSGAASIYSVGDPFTVTANSVVLYGYIVNVADTLLTVVGDALTNHAFSDIAYSKSPNPVGFPVKFEHTPVSTGFSSPPTYTSWFSMVGRDVTWHLATLADGTSNASTLTVTAPVMPGNYAIGFARSKDNGTHVAGTFKISPSTLAVTFYNSIVGSWTSSGLKAVNACIIYKV